MKTLIILFSLFVATYGFIQPEYFADRSISSQIAEAIEESKKQMPCGFPEIGVPPLAPLRFQQKRLRLGGDSLLIDGQFMNFRLDGLDEFDIDEFKVNAVLSTVRFNFMWPLIKVKTDYDATLGLLSMINPNRAGGARMTFVNSTIWGLIKYRLSPLSQKISIRSVEIRASVDNIISEIENLSSIKFLNKKMNQAIEEWLMIAVNENTENMAKFTDRVITPILNNQIGDLTLGDLLGMVGGGGGGGNEGEGPEKQPCIPPEDL